MLTELAPPLDVLHASDQSSGILGHYVATASLTTGVYETFNNFAAVSPGNPTVFEYFRKDLNRPSTDAWVIAPSNGFNRIGESENKAYGKGLGAGVILPKRLLAAALANGAGADFNHLLQDNYESQAFSPVIGGNDVGAEATGGYFQSLRLRLHQSCEKSGEPRRTFRLHCASN